MVIWPHHQKWWTLESRGFPGSMDGAALSSSSFGFCLVHKWVGKSTTVQPFFYSMVGYDLQYTKVTSWDIFIQWHLRLEVPAGDHVVVFTLKRWGVQWAFFNPGTLQDLRMEKNRGELIYIILKDCFGWWIWYGHRYMDKQLTIAKARIKFQRDVDTISFFSAKDVTLK